MLTFLFSFLIFCATFSGKMGLATMRTPNSMGSPNPIKNVGHSPLGGPWVIRSFISISWKLNVRRGKDVVAHGGLFWVNCYFTKSCFRNFQAWIPFPIDIFEKNQKQLAAKFWILVIRLNVGRYGSPVAVLQQSRGIPTAVQRQDCRHGQHSLEYQTIQDSRNEVP